MIWLKNHIAVVYLWVTGFTWTIIIDWEHLFSKIIETGILAFVNGVLCAIGGGLYIWGMKKLKAWKAKRDYLKSLIK